MRDHSEHVQVTREEAVQAILGACAFTPGTEVVPLDEAFGRVLAEDVTAQLDMPNSLTCMMDSVAVHWEDFQDGMPDTSAWVRGVDWEFANTGVGMPEGFDTAIVVEHAVISDDDQHVRFDAAPSCQYAGTRPAGSRMHAGDVLVEAGMLVTPLLAAHMMSGNNTQVRVVAKPKVAFIPTGNELVAAGGEVPRGGNIESNGVMMRGKILEWGGDPLIYGVVPDDPDSLRAAILRAVQEADIVVLNAGSSKGSDDYSLEILEDMGSVLYHQTNHGPGHHSSCSVVDGVPVIGISGPPGGAAFTADFYLYPAIRAFLGLDPLLTHVKARVDESLRDDGKGAGGAPHAKPAAIAGEARPREEGPFFCVKQVVLTQGEDGVPTASLVAPGRPGPVQAERAHAYYLKPSDGIGSSQLIEVDLRPDFQ